MFGFEVLESRRMMSAYVVQYLDGIDHYAALNHKDTADYATFANAGAPGATAQDFYAFAVYPEAPTRYIPLNVRENADGTFTVSGDGFKFRDSGTEDVYIAVATVDNLSSSSTGAQVTVVKVTGNTPLPTGTPPAQ